MDITTVFGTVIVGSNPAGRECPLTNSNPLATKVILNFTARSREFLLQRDFCGKLIGVSFVKHAGMV